MAGSPEEAGSIEADVTTPPVLTSLKIERLTDHRLVVEFPEFPGDGAARAGFLDEMDRLVGMFDENKVIASFFYGHDNKLSYGIFVERSLGPE